MHAAKATNNTVCSHAALICNQQDKSTSTCQTSYWVLKSCHSVAAAAAAAALKNHHHTGNAIPSRLLQSACAYLPEKDATPIQITWPLNGTHTLMAVECLTSQRPRMRLTRPPPNQQSCLAATPAALKLGRRNIAWLQAQQPMLPRFPPPCIGAFPQPACMLAIRFANAST